MAEPQGARQLNPQLERRLEWAKKAAERGDWDKAIEHMRKAIDMLQRKEPVASAITPTLRSHLAVCLANRGGKQAQDAMLALRFAQPSQSQIEEKVGSFLDRSGGGSLLLWAISYVVIAGVVFFLSMLDEDMGSLGERIVWSLVFPFIIAPGLVWVIHRVDRFFRRTASLGTWPPRQSCEVCGAASDYRMDLPGRGEVALCAKHNRELQEELKGLQANPLGRGMLESAEHDLAEALELDPSLQGVEANLREIRAALVQLPR